MDTRLEQLATRPVGRLLWTYSLPAVVGMLVMALYNVVDRIFIGQWVGADAIAGLTVTFPLMNLATAIGVLIGVGSCSRISIVLGAGDSDTASHILGNALSLTIVNGLVYIALFALFMDPLLEAFGASATTLPLARTYMLILLPGLLLTNIAFSLNNVMRASGYPRRAMMTMIIGAATNCILDPLFILVFDMGIAGAALATDIAMAVSAVFVLAHFCRHDTTLRFRKGTYAIRRSIFLAIVSLGAAPALVNAASCGINAIINRTIIAYAETGMADTAIAAAGIFVTYTSLPVTVALGICQGMQPIVGYNFGAGNGHRLWRAYWLAVGAASVITTLPLLLTYTAPELVAMAFTDDTKLIHTTALVLRTAMWAFAPVGFQVISTAFFQSIGKAGKSVFVSLVRQVIFLVPLLILLPRWMGFSGVWSAFPLSDVCATIVAAAMIAWQHRRLRMAATPIPA
ncbi:MAG: MATE family efflux transporter [Muribaculaceae bacterium]